MSKFGLHSGKSKAHGELGFFAMTSRGRLLCLRNEASGTLSLNSVSTLNARRLLFCNTWFSPFDLIRFLPVHWKSGSRSRRGVESCVGWNWSVVSGSVSMTVVAFLWRCTWCKLCCLMYIFKYFSLVLAVTTNWSFARWDPPSLQYNRTRDANLSCVVCKMTENWSVFLEMVKLSAFILNTNMGRNPCIRPSNQTSVNKLTNVKVTKVRSHFSNITFPYISLQSSPGVSVLLCDCSGNDSFCLLFLCVSFFSGGLCCQRGRTWDSEHLMNELQALDNRCFGSECVLLCVCPSCRRGAFTGGEWLYCGCRSLGCSVCILLFFLPPLLFPECVWRRQKGGRRQKISI